MTANTRLQLQATVKSVNATRICHSLCMILPLLVLATVWPAAAAQQPPPDSGAITSSSDGAQLPSDPAPQQSQSQASKCSLGTAIKTIAEDELHIVKAPFSLNSSTMMWNGLVVGATGVLIANDESVVNQVSPSWHSTSINISNGTLYGLGATAGGIFVTGLITHNDHAIETGIRSAEASVDSVILYAALKAVLARQRPYVSNEGKFFSGNWTAGSFPSGHSTLAWTLATVMAREYPNWPMRILMYSAALAVSTTRVTGGVHFPADVFPGAVIGFGVGSFVVHKDSEKLMWHRSPSKAKRVEHAILEHLAIGGQ